MAYEMFGDREVLSQMIFGAPPPSFYNYVNQTQQYFNNMLTDMGQKFVQSSQQLFARMDSDQAYELAKAAMRMVNTHLQEDVIYNMNSLSELQEAPDSMVRWIMAHPTLRQLHHERRIDAYGVRYTDIQPDGLYGWHHTDYAHVYQGWWIPVQAGTVLQDMEDPEEEDVDIYTQLVIGDEEDDNLPKLLDEELVYIMRAHQLVDQAIEDGRDPTSYYDNEIM